MASSSSRWSISRSSPRIRAGELGKAIVAAQVDHLRATVSKGAYVSLMADGEAHRLYAQYGFELTAPRSLGMAFVI